MGHLHQDLPIVLLGNQQLAIEGKLYSAIPIYQQISFPALPTIKTDIICLKLSHCIRW